MGLFNLPASLAGAAVKGPHFVQQFLNTLKPCPLSFRQESESQLPFPARRSLRLALFRTCFALCLMFRNNRGAAGRFGGGASFAELLALGPRFQPATLAMRPVLFQASGASETS